MIKRLPTIRDVAKHAGVSLTTTSYILNKKSNHKFAEDTISKVEAAVEVLGYTPNRMIQAIHKGKSYTIGLGNLLPGITHERMVAGIYEEMARWERYDLLMYFSIGTQRKDKMVFLDGRADGVIFPEESSVNISSYLAQKGLPVVVIYKRNVAPGVACAKADDFQAACLAVRHLWEHGHHRIAHLAGHLADWSDAQERLAGYRSAMNELGVTETPEEWVFNRHSWDSEKCGEALDLWLALPPDIRPSAIFSANDAGALGLIEEAGKRGLKIPEDLSIVGCDNIETSESKLTTIDLNFHEVGRYSVESLINIIEGIKTPEECRTPIQVKLIRRNTVRQYNQKKEG